MATKLTKPVTREVEVSLRGTGFRNGFVARMTDSGILLKPPKGRWSKAYLATWGDILSAGAIRSAEELKRQRAEKRKARRLGL